MLRRLPTRRHHQALNLPERVTDVHAVTDSITSSASDARLRTAGNVIETHEHTLAISKSAENPEQQHAACDENTSRVGCQSFTGTHESTDRLFAGSTVKLPPMTEAELSDICSER